MMIPHPGIAKSEFKNVDGYVTVRFFREPPGCTGLRTSSEECPVHTKRGLSDSDFPRAVLRVSIWRRFWIQAFSPFWRKKQLVRDKALRLIQPILRAR